MQPLREAQLNVDQTALVIGGGISGMAAAQALAAQGYTTHLVEKADRLGGQALKLFQTPDGRTVAERLEKLVAAVEGDHRIQVHLSSEVAGVEGFVGNFETTLKNGAGEESLKHGVAIVATGARPLEPVEYRYGQDARVIGTVKPNPQGRVHLRTQLGTTRLLDPPTGELLPRIC